MTSAGDLSHSSATHTTFDPASQNFTLFRPYPAGVALGDGSSDEDDEEACDTDGGPEEVGEGSCWALSCACTRAEMECASGGISGGGLGGGVGFRQLLIVACVAAMYVV